MSSNVMLTQLVMHVQKQMCCKALHLLQDALLHSHLSTADSLRRNEKLEESCAGEALRKKEDIW